MEKLYVDTRQQDSDANWDAHWYFDSVGIDWEFKCMSIGDYMLQGGKISVDTKANCYELAQNLCSKDHERFRALCMRAQAKGIQLIVLIKEPHTFKSFVKWSGKPITKVKGGTMAKIMSTMHERYGVKFRFCDPAQAGEAILQFLRGEKK